MQGDHLAEMETHDGQCDCQGEQARPPEDGPEKEPPIVDALDTAEPQLVNRTPQRQDVLWIQVDPDFWWLVLM